MITINRSVRTRGVHAEGAGSVLVIRNQPQSLHSYIQNHTNDAQRDGKVLLWLGFAPDVTQPRSLLLACRKPAAAAAQNMP
jgi:hypothetical protein